MIWRSTGREGCALKVYVWDLKGHLKRTLTDAELEARGLGAVAGPKVRPGVTVQDWKFDGERLLASGLFRVPGSALVLPASRLIQFTNFLERGPGRMTDTLPLRNGIELAREAMAVSDGAIYFLPEDLGATNRMFRMVFPNLLKSKMHL